MTHDERKAALERIDERANWLLEVARRYHHLRNAAHDEKAMAPFLFMVEAAGNLTQDSLRALGDLLDVLRRAAER